MSKDGLLGTVQRAVGAMAGTLIALILFALVGRWAASPSPTVTCASPGFSCVTVVGKLIAPIQDQVEQDELLVSPRISTNTLHQGQLLMLRDGTRVEFMRVGESAMCFSEHDCVYGVTRNLDGSGMKSWPAGQPVELIP